MKQAAVLVVCVVLGGCSSAPDSNWYPQRHPECSVRNVSDEGGQVVLPDREEIEVLNSVGFRIFSLLDGRHSPEDIAAELIDEFEVEYDTAIADVYIFLTELDDRRLLAEPMPKELRDKVVGGETETRRGDS